MTKDLDQKIIELMDLFDDEQVTTADKIDRPERATEKQAIDDFMKRNPMAGGGMLVQPSADGSRPGYAEAKFNDSSAGIKVGDDLGQGISQDYKKADGTIMYRATAGKTKEGGNIEQRFTSLKMLKNIEVNMCLEE